MSKSTLSANGGAMSAAEARHFLETCNDEIEAGMAADLRSRILAANGIVAADRLAQREAKIAALRAGLARNRPA